MEIIAHIPHPIRDRIDAWRGQIRETARRSLQPDAAALYLALITGETGYLSREIRDSFMAAGVTHILSISGSHLGLIGAVVFWLARRSILALPPPWLLRLTLRATPTRLAAAFTIPCVLFYAILGGAEVATIRSLLMLGVFFGAVLLGREVHVGTGLAFAALLIVLWDPLAPLDLSFQLSFLSVLTILLLLLYRRRDSSIPEHVPFKSVAKRAGEQVLEVLLIGAAVTVMTLPLIATHFHQIQWVGLLSNLIIIPLVGIFIVPLGLVGCLATLLSSGDGLQGASILQLVLDALLWIVRSCARLPGAHWMVASPPLWQVLLFYGCLVSTLFRRDRWFAYVTGSLAVVLVALWIWSPRQLPPEGTTRVTFLDVGQGDAAVIEAPNGRVMLIDGGGASDWSDQGRAVIAPYLWNRGIRRLDLVIATHPQLDHIGGLVYIAEEFRIAQFWNNGVARDISFMQRLNEILTSRQVPIKAVSSAEAPLSWGGCTIAILNPFPTSAHTSSPRIYDGRDLNNTSLVLRLACRETSILFTADIEQDAEARLIGTGVIEGTVLKVPHHGSAGSLHQPFLEAVRPKLAIVSVGLGNPYRHPSLKMLETYERMNINVLRTDRDGAVTILASKADVQVGCEAARRLKRIRPGSAHIALEEWSNLRRLGVNLAPCRSA
jgi:competence protein ComEC